MSRGRPWRIAALTALLASLVACGPSATEVEEPWHRLDLTAVAPRVEIAPRNGAAAVETVTAHLGEQRDPNDPRAAALYRETGEVRALAQAVGSRLAWKVAVGREAYLSFTPLPQAGVEPPIYRVGVRDGAGRLAELARLTPEPAGANAPAVVTVDLGPWAGTEVEVLLQIDAPASPPAPRRALWSGAALYHRLAAATAAAATAERPSVLLLGIDTLRADAVGFQRDRSTGDRHASPTPTLDRLAAESDVWLRAFSTFNVTNPSFISIFTGLYGKDHGIYDLTTPLPPERVTLAEIFRDAGYDTAAVISARHLGDRNSGLGQGFAEVTLAEGQLAAERAVEAAMDWLARPRQAPTFLWLHLFDPHTPHTPPQPYALGFAPAEPAGLTPMSLWAPFRSPGPRGFRQPRLGGHFDLYAGEVAYLDRQIDRLLGFLESRGLLASTLVAVVADHGENLEDHGILYRHSGLFDTTTHVPLLLRRPGPPRPGRRFSGLVETQDLFPTVLAAAGLEAPPQDGRDLAELTPREDSPGRRAVFAEHANGMGESVRTATHRYMVSRDNPHLTDGPYLFDLEADPGETTNLAGRGLAVEEHLAGILERWKATRAAAPGAPAAAGPELTAEEIERLRALGYL